MKWFMYWFDRGIIAFASWRAGRTPRNWKAYMEFKAGCWDLGLCTQKQAEAKVTKDGAHKVKYVDIDEATIIYE